MQDSLQYAAFYVQKKKRSKGNTCVCSSLQKKHSQDELETKDTD